jgi:glycosyltransferase involved in cell wall biosynthesis
VAADQAEAWRAALAGLLEDPGQCARLVARGRERVGRFRWPETARQTWRVYRQVLGLPDGEGAA